MFPHLSNWSTLRTLLAITITVSLLWASVVVWSAPVGAQGQSQERRAGKPRREKPEGALPDLEEVKGETHEREAPPAEWWRRSGRAPLPRRHHPETFRRHNVGYCPRLAPAHVWQLAHDHR